MKLHNFIIFLGTGIIIIAFIVAVYHLKKEKPNYFKYIFLFIVLGLLISYNTIINNNYSWYYNKKYAIFTEMILMLIQSLLLGLFFNEILNKSKFSKIIKPLLFVSILIQITLIITVFSTNKEVRPNITQNLIMLIFCFFYLKDLMTNKPTLIIIRSSIFWIVMGIFYSSCICLPVNSLIPYITKNDKYINFSYQIFSIGNISLIVLYLLIIKSYLCLKHPQNL